MATKTISLDHDAYEALASRKRRDQTFSELIRAHFGRRTTGAELETALADIKHSEDALEGIEEQIRTRRKSPVRVPEL